MGEGKVGGHIDNSSGVKNDSTSISELPIMLWLSYSFHSSRWFLFRPVSVAQIQLTCQYVQRHLFNMYRSILLEYTPRQAPTPATPAPAPDPWYHTNSRAI